ncbi:MAG TPA: LuxR C-terminal-related transcriptional regulator, partial [Anaerolineales bacterium]|nr:LuxR C-terminal-related transcriptional regulator [Anaerolineales bacterium]
MAAPILATKLYVPPSRPRVVVRPRLIELLDEGMNRKLILISAPAGFGKSTLVSEWVAGSGRPAAWLSLDEGDNDPTRFLAYLVAAVRTVEENIGEGLLVLLNSPQPPSIEPVLTSLLNELAAVPHDFTLVLDDYHRVESKDVGQAVAFLVEHLPPPVHLLIATREDPPLPLARYRARGQLTELRAADLRFTPAEAAEFLNRVMGLNLSADDIAALETRTEGWIAGLQLAALSMQGHQDTAGFIKSFSGGHHFVVDYLMEEVLGQQPQSIRSFLLRTSILDRLCGSLCDAVLCEPSLSGQETLEHLERANLFIVPLDNERRWYRYHHLFAELLRQRLHQGSVAEAELHVRASQWYEQQGLALDAFQHAVAANDVDRAQRLIEAPGTALHLHGATRVVLNWVESLPATVLDARPYLRWMHASLPVVLGQTSGVEERLQALEAALAAAARPGAEPDDKTRDLMGKIAVARATLGLAQQQPDIMLAEARRALEYLHPDNLGYRSEAIRLMGHAYHLQGERAAAGRAYAEALSMGKAAADVSVNLFTTTLLAQVQVLENQLYLAAETYRSVLPQMSEWSPSNVGVVHHGLAGICYEWNDLEAAELHGQESLKLARQYDQLVNRLLTSQVFLARLDLARGDLDGAAALLVEAQQSAHQKNFSVRLPDIAAAQVLLLLRQGNTAAAAQLAQQYELPLSQARVCLAQREPAAALAILEPFRQQMEAKGWLDEQLRVMVLEALTYHAQGDWDKALQALTQALSLAQPGGFVRIFLDEGAPMAELLSEAAAQSAMPDYIGRLLAAFEAERPQREPQPEVSPRQPLIEPLSERELEVLHLLAQGLSNKEICERLFLALDTVKGHNRRIFSKLQVQRRTEAIARARELGL